VLASWDRAARGSERTIKETDVGEGMSRAMSRPVGGEGRKKKEEVEEEERGRKESRALFPSRINWGWMGGNGERATVNTMQ
jgi:hypothetical protein